MLRSKLDVILDVILNMLFDHFIKFPFINKEIEFIDLYSFFKVVIITDLGLDKNQHKMLKI